MRNGCSDCNGCSADDDRVRVHSPAVVAAYCQVTFTVPALVDVFVESLSSVITALAPLLPVAGVVRVGEVCHEIAGCSAFFDTYHFIAARNVPVEAALVEVCDISAVGFAAVCPTVSWLLQLQSTGKPLPNLGELGRHELGSTFHLIDIRNVSTASSFRTFSQFSVLGRDLHVVLACDPIHEAASICEHPRVRRTKDLLFA